MADFSTTIITRFEIEAEAQNAALSDTSARLEAVGRQLEKSTDGYDKLRSAVDATTDRLRIFGVRGRALADAIDDHIADPVERARLALHHFRIQSERTTDGIDAFGQHLGRFRVEMAAADQQFSEFGLTFANIGIAAAAAGVAVVAFAADSVRKFIEANDEAKASAEGLTESFRHMQEAIGGLIFQRGGMGGFFDDMSTGIRKVGDEVNEVNRLLAGGEFMDALRIITGITKAPSSDKSSRTILGDGSVVTTTTETSQPMANPPIALTPREQAEAERERVAQWELDRFDAERQRRGTRGGRSAVRAEDPSSQMIGLADRYRMDQAAMSRRGASIGAVMDVSKIDVFGAKMDEIREKNRLLLSETASGMAGVRFEIEQAQSPMIAFFEGLNALLDTSIESFTNFGAEVASSLGALAATSGNLKDFGNNILAALGTLADGFANFLLTTGQAWWFVPGGQWAAVGMTAGGLALKALSGALGAQSSVGGAQKGGGGRGPAATAPPPIAPRALLTDRGGEDRTTIIKVYLDGDEVSGGAAIVFNRAARLGLLDFGGA